ncbi:MAG: hypothetical protein KF819_04290 [Labilithrix sp.]|nr:hypothetical protein [Labilithrix sp.]
MKQHSSSVVVKLLAAMAVIAVGVFSIGCGPAPGYEPEPRMPVGYAPPAPEPLSSEELAAQQQARGEVAIGEDADEYGDTDPSALTEFKPALEGHGVWVDDATYGTVWVPNENEVGADFTPYVTAGHWTYDDTYSWTWVSDYEWGWVPYHYGRWVHVGPRGWAWIPGRRYAGAWVTWRVGSPGYGYVGWAPAPPDWYWYHGVAVGWTFGWSPYYVYCPHQHIYSPTVVTHVVRGPAARPHDGRTQDYVPASPGVGGSNRVIANPGVGSGDRVVASPSVGGVGGRVGATPKVGPSPSEMGIQPESIAPVPADHRGLARARAFSTPRTAVAAGAAPPINARPRVTPSAPDVVAGRGARTFDGSRAIAPVPPRQAALPDLRPTPRTASPAPGYLPPASSGLAATAPAYRSAPSVASPPPQRSAPSVSPAPSYRSTPSFGSSSPSVRSSSPSFRSSPSVSSSPRSSPTPSIRSSSPSFRSAPSVSSPSVRSPSPRVSSPPSFRSSSPSRSVSPSVRARR